MEKGNLSINSDNILPIIKKWLYSETDIFIRELVSNACDAITKHKKLVALGEADENKDYRVTVSLNSKKKTIKIIDNGLGMTKDEIVEYITQIAFSGANSFIEKYKTNEGGDIIGHFGLGFYSAFMVADKVQIDSLSYKKDSEAAMWICDGGVEYEMDKSDKDNIGTTITLYVNKDNKEYLNEYKIKEILSKYCSFMPVPIYFVDENNNEEKEEIAINDTEPLYLKKPKDCSDEEYKTFYHKVFTDFNEPLFWIHLNMDYPFRLKGILYFPKLKHELESIEGQVKLYNNQVFIAENIKEVIPEFLLLLKGVIDCPDLPLNVSRSFLQNDGYVTKMSKYIVKKVSDKLTSLFKKERETYEGFWDDINQFIKYGCIRENDFYDKTKSALLFKTIYNDYLTLDEYEEKTGNKTVYYVTDVNQQGQYIKLFKDKNLNAVLLETRLDNPFMSFIESKGDGFTFKRIDSDISDALSDKDKVVDEKITENYNKMFKNALNKEITVEVKYLEDKDVSAVIELDESSRRMNEMSMYFGAGMNLPTNEKLILNLNNPVVSLLEKENNNKELIIKQIYDLAIMSHKPLNTEEMTEFISRSNKILELLSNNKGE